jgi:hypothetical protein
VPRWGVALSALAILLALPASGPADGVAESSGAFVQAIPLRIPAFHGIEPRLVLGYSSQGGSGFAGVGWGLSGFGVIERFSPGLGSPRYDANDVYTLNGVELLPCPAPNASPSCTTGGTHTTRVESYLRVRFDAQSNWWTVWSRNGTRTVYKPVYSTPSGTLRWGHSTTIDAHDNEVTYTWACPTDDDCYAGSVTFGPYSVEVSREARPDVMSFATGHAGTIRRVRSRLSGVVVRNGGVLVREYRLAYTTSGLTNRSLLQSVQEKGSDGSALPPHVFEYQTDPLGASFQRWGE